MATDVTNTGITNIGNVPWGSHFCHFYETKQDLLDILVPFFAAGLANNEFCMWILFDPLSQQDAIEALRRAVPDIDQKLAHGDIQILPYSHWYLTDGVFDMQGVLDGWNRKLREALAKGYTGVRVNGNGAWLTEKDLEQFNEYEVRLNDIIVDWKMIALCTYALAATKATILYDVARSHQFAIAKRRGRWEVLETPELLQAKHELETQSQELERRVTQRTAELAAANEDLRAEIAERKRVEESLRVSEQQSRQMAEQLRVSSEKLRALAAKVQSAREEEGIRIAREIHDELGSALTSLKWGLEGLIELITGPAGRPAISSMQEAIETLMRLTDTTIQSVKRIAADLRPSVLDDLGLAEAVQWQAQQFEARTHIVCHCVTDIETIELTREQSTALFRIFQEALTNILRHAEATRVDIALEEQEGQIVLTVGDNGKGITEQEQSGNPSLGLLGMKERALLIGGTIEITGVAGKGTLVTVRIPISNASGPPASPA